MIKGNESDVSNIAFEILAKKQSKFFGFILFGESHNSVTRYSIIMRVASNCSIFKLPENGVKI